MTMVRSVLLVALAFTPLSLAVACSSTEASSGDDADPGAPAAPSELTASQMGAGIHITWKDNASDESEFQIDRREGTGAYAKIASVVFDTVQFHDTSVTAGRRYTYRVRAIGPSG